MDHVSEINDDDDDEKVILILVSRPSSKQRIIHQGYYCPSPIVHNHISIGGVSYGARGLIPPNITTPTNFCCW